MDFGLVSIHYRQPAAVEQLLIHLRDWTVAPGPIVLVDNSASGPELAAAIDAARRRHPALPPVEVIDAGGNVGYAAAANLGLARLRQLGARRALVLTQEARLAPGAAESLAAALDARPWAAVAAPILEYASAPGTVFSSGGILLPDARTAHRDQGRRRSDLPVAAEAETVDWADGAALLIDLVAADAVGDFDPAYFLYVEEIDFQLRLAARGRPTIVVPRATAYQEPGRYPVYLRYRNHRYLTAKLGTAPWPWRRQLARDVVRRAAGRTGSLGLSDALRGVRDARDGRMGSPDPLRPVAGDPPTTILVEFEADQLHTGVAARLRHLQLAFPEARVVAVQPGPRAATSLGQRLDGAARYRPPAVDGRIVVVALGSPPMMRLARRLRRRGLDVRLDLCDSTVLQWRARRAAADPRLLAVGGWMFAEHAASPYLPVSYISERDAAADSWLNRLRDVRVVAARPPVELAGLPAFRWPAERIVLCGDFASFHNARGLAVLCAAVEQVPGGLPVHLFGPTAPEVSLPPGVDYRGWAAGATDLLAGDTIAFVSNRVGSGVPNKLLEAVASGRPVIAHTDLRSVVRELPQHHPTIFWYDDLASLTDLLRTLRERSAVAA